MSANIHILVRVGPIERGSIEDVHRSVAEVLRRHDLDDELACRASVADDVIRCTHPKRPVSLTGLSRFLPRLEKDLTKAVRVHGRGVRARIEISDADDARLSSSEQIELMRRIARKQDALSAPKTVAPKTAATKTATPKPPAQLAPYKFVGKFTRPAKELEAIAVARGHAILRGSTYDTEGVVVNGKGPRALDAAARAVLRREGIRIITEDVFVSESGVG